MTSPGTTGSARMYDAMALAKGCGRWKHLLLVCLPSAFGCSVLASGRGSTLVLYGVGAYSLSPAHAARSCSLLLPALSLCGGSASLLVPFSRRLRDERQSGIKAWICPHFRHAAICKTGVTRTGWYKGMNLPAFPSCSDSQDGRDAGKSE